jgi:hypothetical protein
VREASIGKELTMSDDLNNITKTENEEQTTQDRPQELSESQLGGVVGGLATTLANIANLRHEMLKSVANNLRA